MSDPTPSAKVFDLVAVIARVKSAHLTAMTPEQLADDAARADLQQRARAMSGSGATIRPEDHRAIIAGTLADTPHLIAVRRWLAGKATVLVLCGSVGCGKTVAACWALAERSGLLVSAADLARMQSDFDRADWNALCRAFVVIVDDLGDETHADKFSAALKLLISARGSHLGRTILTSNFPASLPAGKTGVSLKTRYPDEKLWSRIAQSYEVVSIDGPDRRRGES